MEHSGTFDPAEQRKTREAFTSRFDSLFSTEGETLTVFYPLLYVEQEQDYNQQHGEHGQTYDQSDAETFTDADAC